jgi:hypothetical protein
MPKTPEPGSTPQREVGLKPLAGSKATLDYVSPDLLDFDPTNPRFGGLMTRFTQENIQKELMGEPYFASGLIDSLLANGFIDYEPLVVKRNGDRFTVVEGNRRLAAIREIRANLEKYSGRKSDLDRIPVLVFPEKPDEQQQTEMRVYLGVRHLLGFREWPSLSKAQYLDRECKRPGGLDAVIKETQITSAGIKRFLQLEVEQKNLTIQGYDKKSLTLLLEYLYGTRMRDGGRDISKKIVRDTRSLSRLSIVLNSELATAALRSGKSIEVAEIYVDTREESIKRLARVTKALGLLVKKLVKGQKNSESQRLQDSFKQFEAAANEFTVKEE